MNTENGNISIHTENILPIIKKWLYSDKDIFIRELISNGCDAVNKLQKLTQFGEATVSADEKYRIDVTFNKDENTLKFTDNGIGMTADEVKKYINQVAFSGAEEFISKYKDKIDESNQIIGHFGLGFYSAFMVAQKVQIDTLSYLDGSAPVKWVCDGGTEYEISESDKSTRGTTITLYMNDEDKEFLSEFKLKEIIHKYCAFMPVEIYLTDEIKPAEETKAEGENEADKEKEEPKPLNNPTPLWVKAPKDCTDEEYKAFYKEVFNDYNDPLFWIHLNVDYPFNLKGILYFPKLKHEFETMEGQIKLFNNQVFVADNIKEVIPEFLLLLKGALDFKDLPLNVSRSFLQNDKTVNQIAKHITKKVADKLNQLFKNERENYNKFWDDINPFVKYGCIRESDFYDKVKDVIIYKTTNDEYVTLKDYLEKNKEKHENKVFYVSDELQQSQYIKLFKDNGLEAIILPSMIDNHFISFLESKESGVSFSRIDSDISETMKDTDNKDGALEKDQKEKLEGIFKEALNDDKLKFQLETLKSTDIPAIVLLSEQSRRMQEMSKMFGGMNMPSDMFPTERTLVLNENNNLIKSVLKLAAENKNDDVALICEHIYDLAMMSHKQLNAEEMSKFIERSNTILNKLMSAI